MAAGAPHGERAIFRAFTLASAGLKDRALERLEQAHREHDPQLLWIKADLRIASLRAGPRFRAPVKRIGLEE